jgi:predicted nucleotidyltransferase
LAAAMAEQQLEWYVFGAQAAIMWGSARLSADVDITAAIAPPVIDSFVGTMRRHDFDLVFSDSDFLTRTRVLPFIHRPTRIPLDVVLAGPGLEEDFMRRAIAVDLEGARIPVISPEDLIVTKVLAGRSKDIEDIRSVIHQRRTSLDMERIREILRLLERILGQGDLLPVFEKVLREAPSTPVRATSKSKRKPKRK